MKSDLKKQLSDSERNDAARAITVRMDELNISQRELSKEAGISEGSMCRILHPKKQEPGIKVKTVCKVIAALGYPNATLDSLFNDTPKLPDWVAARDITKTTDTTQRHALSHAVRCAREARGLRQQGEGLSFQHIESGGSYSEEYLQRALDLLRVGEADTPLEARINALHTFHQSRLPTPRDPEYGNSHLPARHRNLELLGPASRILRSYWNIRRNDLVPHMPKSLRVNPYMFSNLESESGISDFRMDNTLIGVLTALYNVSELPERTPRERLFTDSPNLRAVARIANEDRPPTYHPHFVRMVDRALDEVIHAALEIEVEALENTESQIGLHSSRQPDYTPLAERMGDRSGIVQRRR